jgi:hypothetical protein
MHNITVQISTLIWTESRRLARASRSLIRFSKMPEVYHMGCDVSVGSVSEEICTHNPLTHYSDRNSPSVPPDSHTETTLDLSITLLYQYATPRIGYITIRWPTVLSLTLTLTVSMAVMGIRMLRE